MASYIYSLNIQWTPANHSSFIIWTQAMQIPRTKMSCTKRWQPSMLLTMTNWQQFIGVFYRQLTSQNCTSLVLVYLYLTIISSCLDNIRQIIFSWSVKKIAYAHVYNCNCQYVSQGPYSCISYDIIGFWLVEMAISTNQKPTIYRNLYENMSPHH